jgi:hypothetical protein
LNIFIQGRDSDWASNLEHISKTTSKGKGDVFDRQSFSFTGEDHHINAIVIGTRQPTTKANIPQMLSVIFSNFLIMLDPPVFRQGSHQFSE